MAERRGGSAALETVAEPASDWHLRGVAHLVVPPR